MNAKIVLVGRMLLGAIMLVFGLNYFFKFLPMPSIPGDGGTFVTIMAASGYMLFVKICEIIIGIALLSNRYVPLALLVAAPLSVNFVLFHLFFAPEGIGIALVTLLFNALLMVAYKKAYNPVLKAQMKI